MNPLMLTNGDGRAPPHRATVVKFKTTDPLPQSPCLFLLALWG
jgi:hypothetical protein